MESWLEKVTFPIKRVLISVAVRLGIRESGLLKLRHEVRTCKYEDVRIMWDMLQRTEKEITRLPPEKPRRKPIWKIFAWASPAHLCRGF